MILARNRSMIQGLCSFIRVGDSIWLYEWTEAAHCNILWEPGGMLFNYRPFSNSFLIFRVGWRMKEGNPNNSKKNFTKSPKNLFRSIVQSFVLCRAVLPHQSPVVFCSGAQLLLVFVRKPAENCEQQRDEDELPMVANKTTHTTSAHSCLLGDCAR